MSSASMVGLLDTLTFPELLTILVVGLVVLGPDKLPGMARQAGQWLAKLREMSGSLQREVREVLDEPEMQSLKELGEFAARPWAKLAEYARNATADNATGDGDSPTKSVAVGPDHPMAAATPEQVAAQPTADPAPTGAAEPAEGSEAT